MRVGVVGRESDGPRDGFVGTSKDQGTFGIPTVAVDEREGVRRPDPGLTVVRIDSQRVFEHRDGSLRLVLLLLRGCASGPSRGVGGHRGPDQFLEGGLVELLAFANFTTHATSWSVGDGVGSNTGA